MRPFTIRQLSSLNQGLTLLECLVAILVVNLALVMLTAPLTIVTATRLRNDRINKATELGREYVDYFRSLMEQDIRSVDLLPPLSSSPQLQQQPHPTIIVDCGNRRVPTNPSEACERQVGLHRFGVQLIRGQGQGSESGVQLTRGQGSENQSYYPLLVRIYEANAIESSSNLPAPPVKEQPVLFTSGSDMIAGGSKEPLVVLETIVTRGDSGTTLTYLKQINSSSSSSGNNPSP